MFNLHSTMQSKWFSSIFFVTILTIVLTSATNTFETISDDDLVDRIKSNEFVIVFFAKKSNCVDCDKYENELFKIRDEFRDMFPAQVVKVIDSQLVRLYSPKKEPAIVFFRHGVPLLYSGNINSDEIYQKLDQNRTPTVKELTDDTFEHLTQAATGATTGDWLILFYNRECIDCQRLGAVWEAVGAALRNRVNVARVDKDFRGIKTAKRFGVQKAPEFIFIRQGNFYRYDIPKYDIKSFVSFAQEFYRNARAEKIKAPASPFDELVASIVMYIKSYQANGINNLINDNTYLLPAITVIGFILFILVLKCCLRFRKSGDEQKKKEKSKKSK
ncbi:thioredoxin domain-containing protein [Contarinia nasturtii]|uniref:thioredoxin domain-containing protein n=1 Tax=Contarinia nasturtii TaxID=265458 RepID=UPI0012D41A46|nr:thioredoxin domain-containing protein [Contarinia nasturtii]